MGWWLLMGLVLTLYLCLDCLAKGFTPISKTPLQETKVHDNEKKTHVGISPEDIAKLIKPDHGFKTKLDLRAWLMIAGLILAFIALLFGDIIRAFVDNGI